MSPAANTLRQISLHWGEGDREAAEKLTRAPDIEVGDLLGAGGMGQVRVAKQRSLGRDVAVKLLHDDGDDGAASALIREAVLAGFLAHPGVIPVHALGLDDDSRPLIVMKRIDGVAWHDLLEDQTHADWNEWDARFSDRLEANLHILAQVSDVVSFAHSRGVIHRDIKPENIMLGKFGEVYLVDWGVATRISDIDDTLVGTPLYMAPEMVSGHGVDTRTDVYLLASTLHEVLTGTYRHSGADLEEVLRAAYESSPIDYDHTVPTELAQLCNRATDRDPSLRPDSALTFRAALTDYLHHRASIALSDAASGRLAELQAMLTDGGDASAPEIALATSSVGAEAKFGFRQALVDWPGNEAARTGLERCLECLADLHIRRRDAPLATAVVGEMKEPSRELRERLAKLETEVAEDQREAGRLRAMERDLDPSVSTGARRVMAVGMVGCAVIVSAIGLWQTGGTGEIPHGRRVLFALFLFSTGLAGFWYKRKELTANSANRRIVAVVLVALGFVVVNRLVSWRLALNLADLFAVESMMLAAICSATAIFILRWVWIMAFILAATCATILALPQWAAPAYSLGAVSAAVTAVIFWRRT